MKTLILIVLLSLTSLSYATNVEPVFSQPLPKLPESQEVAMVTVEYGPGEFTPPHRHNAHTYVYVLSGKVGMQVAGAKEQILSAGDAFYELPTDVHTVSKNMSDTESAKFLVIFIKTQGTPFTVMIK